MVTYNFDDEERIDPVDLCPGVNLKPYLQWLGDEKTFSELNAEPSEKHVRRWLKYLHHVDDEAEVERTYSQWLSNYANGQMVARELFRYILDLSIYPEPGDDFNERKRIEGLIRDDIRGNLAQHVAGCWNGCSQRYDNFIYDSSIERLSSREGDHVSLGGFVEEHGSKVLDRLILEEDSRNLNILERYRDAA